MTTSLPRRSILRLSLLTLGIALLPNQQANALSMKDAAASDALDTISLGKRKATELKKRVSKWPSVCGEDEKLIVLRYIPIWLQPAQAACKTLLGLVNPKKVDVEKLTAQTNLMFGHLLELSTEADNKNTAGIMRELDEIMETADDVFKICESR